MCECNVKVFKIQVYVTMYIRNFLLIEIHYRKDAINSANLFGFIINFFINILFKNFFLVFNNFVY